MPGRVRAVKRATDPIRGRGRIPLAKRRSSGHPEFRPAGAPTVSALEARIADAVLDAVQSIPHQTFLDAVVSGDADGFGVAVLNRLSEASERIEEALMEAFIVSGETSALELGKELSRAYSKVGKAADVPLPSEVALRFRFDKTDPRATAWVRGEAGQLITNMTNESRLLIRNVIGDAFDSQRTWAQTGRGIFGQLATITPSPSVRDYADALGANLNGLTTRYERAVVNRVTALADDYASRGITGTKALQGMRKEGERYAERLRRSRSRTIARTERMRAHNQARLLSYQQAIESGLASSEHSRKEWQTGPFDVCPICVSTAGQKVKVNEQFTLPNGAQVDCPPAHPNCRCNMTMVTDTRLYQPSDRLGTGLPGDPFRTTPRGFTETGQTLSQRPLPGVPPATPTETVQPQPAPEAVPVSDPLRNRLVQDPMDKDAAISLYQRGDANSGYTNRKLFKEEFDTLTEDQLSFIRGLDEAMTASEETRTLYRGIDINTFRSTDQDMIGLYQNLKVGDEIPQGGFLSTTSNKNTAKQFSRSMFLENRRDKGGILFEIETPKGTRNIEMPNRSGSRKKGMYHDEQEVLLERGGRLVVQSVRRGSNNVTAVRVKFVRLAEQ